MAKLSSEAIEAYLEPLGGWKPTEEEKGLAKERIEWLNKVRVTPL
jgi:hypothetical protein